MGRRSFGAIRSLPSGRWQASYIGPDGLRRPASRTFTTKADAQAWLTLRQAELLRGEWLDLDLGRVPLRDYVGRWVEEHRMSPRTRSGYERISRLHIVPFLGRHNLGDLTTERVRAWRAELLRSGRSEFVTASAYRLLRAVLNTAVDDGRLRRNPCRIKGADAVRTPERPFASVTQVDALAEALGGRWRVFVLTAAYTGLRWGELVALRRRDIDLTAGRLTVSRALVEHAGRVLVGPPKSAAGVRVVGLPPVLVEALTAHLAEFVGEDLDAMVFTGPKGATPKRGNWRNQVDWPGAVAAAGLAAGFHFHDLRHTGNYLASQAGASTRELMHRMGHSSMRAALIYQHATDASTDVIARQVDELVRRQRKSKPDGSSHQDERAG